MGTAIGLEIAGSADPGLTRRMADATFAWFHEVDQRFSTFKHGSEVNRLDRGELAIEECSADLRWVLCESARLWDETDGYFDVHAAGHLDPSGFVKGWSVQVASDRLAATGLTDHCLNAGGDVRVRGCDGNGSLWRIGIQHPFENQHISWVLAAADLAVATSGTYERGFHVLDPLRRIPARDLCSVTVTGPDLGKADAYATAAVAMGAKGLDWLAALPGYECAVVTDDGLAFRSEGLQVAPVP
ncbi:MAG TPA: FAD:protein FMN transferase [Candidatus Limnocylindrales bacterium]